MISTLSYATLIHIMLLVCEFEYIARKAAPMLGYINYVQFLATDAFHVVAQCSIVSENVGRKWLM